MSKFEKLIPFILYFETGLKREYLKLPLPEMFAMAKKTGYANDPADSGGATMCGVTIATYRAYRKRLGYASTSIDDLKAISFTAWRDILKTMFWDKWKADRIENQSVANILVDFVWASGVNGVKLPQRVLDVEADGVVGPVTLAAVNTHNPEILFSKLHDARICFVEDIVKRKPSQVKFIKGWKRRINCITFQGLKYE